MTSTTALRRLQQDVGELLERHEAVRDLSEFQRYATDPLGFFREVLKGEPWSRQVDIAEAVRDHPLTVVRSCNSAGKDWVAAHLALWWVYAVRGLAIITGPTERQVREIVMGEVGRAFHRAKDLPGSLFQMALRLEGEEARGILAFTSRESSRLTGFHAARVLVIITEAQGVEDFTYEGMLSCATGDEDRILAVGNPLNPTGRFYQACRSSAWHAIRIAASEHPNVREGRQIIPGGVSRAFIDRMASEFGRESGVFKARVEAEFPEESQEGLLRRSWVDRAVERFEDASDTKSEGRLVVAIDPARYGPDETLVAIREGEILSRLVSWRETSTMETTGRVVGLLKELNLLPDSSPPWMAHRDGLVVVDEVGLGAAVLDRLQELEYQCRGFNGGRKARNSRRFRNVRAETFWRLREKLEAGEIGLPPDDELAEELLAIQWSPTSTGQIQIEAKDQLRARLGRSIDRADATSMAFSRAAEGRHQTRPSYW